jgi:aldose sugar dehydrogenase
MNKNIIILILLILLAIIGIFFALNFRQTNEQPTLDLQDSVFLDNIINEEEAEITIVAENLEIPWDIAFTQDGDIIITERNGRLRLIDNNGQLVPEPVAALTNVYSEGEGGLLGLTLHPQFEVNRLIYIYHTYLSPENNILNRVVRYRFERDVLSDESVIIEGIPGARFHNGGRIRFGPDEHLYITTGDALDPQLSQDTNSLAGKILRIEPDGGVPRDNPFGNEVYSYGHRNPQGLAWDNEGNLWATEHGSTALDELNLIERGNNYGWPEIEGDSTREGMETPFLHSGNNTWAPSGIALFNNSLLFTGLRGASLYQVRIIDGSPHLERHFQNTFGRLRAVEIGHDSNIYLITNNRDGRGNPQDNDDKIIRIDLNLNE